jgi:hypothetical protein
MRRGGVCWGSPNPRLMKRRSRRREERLSCSILTRLCSWESAPTPLHGRDLAVPLVVFVRAAAHIRAVSTMLAEANTMARIIWLTMARELHGGLTICR